MEERESVREMDQRRRGERDKERKRWRGERE